MGTHMKHKPALSAITATVVTALGIAMATTAATNHDTDTATMDDLRAQVTALTTERDQYKDSLDAQTDHDSDQIAGLKDQVAHLKNTKPKTKTVTKPAPELTFYEDGSWVQGEDSGCAPTALCDDTYQESLIAHVPSGLATWSGFRVGEVILCPKGYEVSIDDAEDGMTWAACL